MPPAFQDQGLAPGQRAGAGRGSLMSLSGMVEISRTFVEAKFVFPLPFGERVRVRGAALTPLRFRFRPPPPPPPPPPPGGGGGGGATRTNKTHHPCRRR